MRERPKEKTKDLVVPRVPSFVPGRYLERPFLGRRSEIRERDDMNMRHKVCTKQS